VTPGLCGLFETANNLIEAERALGIDAVIVDPLKEDVPLDGDLLVDHSGLTDAMWKSGLPVIHVRHGRPHSSFLMQESGGKKVFTSLRNGRARYARVVTFWKQHVPYLELLFDRTDIVVLPPPVDLKAWHPSGSVHDFGANKGVVNLVCADIFRLDEDPFHVLVACGLLPGDFKVHLAGLKGGINQATNTLVSMLGSNRGSMFSWIKELACLYRAADLVISPHKIATRAVREAMACGVPVLADLGNEHAAFTADAHDAKAFAEGIIRASAYVSPTKLETRLYAERHFDPLDTAKAFLKVARSVIEEKVPCTI